jgi:hypothetical protein
MEDKNTHDRPDAFCQDRSGGMISVHHLMAPRTLHALFAPLASLRDLSSRSFTKLR